ncbi:PIN-like domain-containing protein [Peribacillus frigoritolerans]|nr:PIN-like domain-containing protein [Peribacillus frigoritolerans]
MNAILYKKGRARVMSIFGKQYGLILDTNVLIDLFQPEKVPRETFNGFMDCVVLGKVKLIIPTQVKREWDKHKVERNQEYLEAAIRTIDKHKKLADHMPNDEEKNEVHRANQYVEENG